MTKKEIGTALFLLSMYVAGIIGIAWPVHQDFIFLTPFNLITSLALVLWHHQNWNKNLGLFLVICFLTGFTVELLGVQTGFIFGDYHYGEVLGWKIWETPLLIGCNWALLVYASAATVNQWFKHWPIITKMILGALLMTLLDVLIEPVAMHWNFWNWAENQVPLQNYIAWFLVALPLQGSFYTLLTDTTNKVAIVLFILQFLFFGCLGLTI